MSESFELILDRCLDRLQQGEAINAILAEYPEYAGRLKPLLETAVKASSAYSLKSSAETKLAWKQKFNEALVAQREARRITQPWFRRRVVRNTIIATFTTVAVALLVVFVGLPALSPSSPQIIVATPNPDGNFAFLISDDVNAIADFESVIIDISKVGLQQKDTGDWVEFDPQETLVDLVKLPGDVSQEVWRGNVPPSEYSQAFIYIDNVTGILKETHEETEIKLPSNKLHVSVPFSVSEDAITSFTYDITVFATGNQQNIKYILKPQAGESGATQSLKDSSGDQSTNDDRPGKPEETTVPPTDIKPTRKPK